MSLRARQAMSEAEVVIGYSTYIKLLQGQGLLEGKAVIRSPMTEEIGRCLEAIALARSGKVNLAPFITSKILVDDIVEQGYQRLITNKDNEVKILVSMR